MSKNTATQFNEVIEYCREIFEVKQKDYGTAWEDIKVK